MVTSQQSLWVHVLQGKYIKGDSLSFINQKRLNLLPLWPRLLDCVPALRQCCSMSIGVGLETNFLYDNWLGSTGPLINHILITEESICGSLMLMSFITLLFVIEIGLSIDFPTTLLIVFSLSTRLLMLTFVIVRCGALCQVSTDFKWPRL